MEYTQSDPRQYSRSLRKASQESSGMAPLGQLDAVKGMRSPSHFELWTVFHRSFSLLALSPQELRRDCCLLLSCQSSSASQKRNKAEQFPRYAVFFRTKHASSFYISLRRFLVVKTNRGVKKKHETYTCMHTHTILCTYMAICNVWSPIDRITLGRSSITLTPTLHMTKWRSRE